MNEFTEIATNRKIQLIRKFSEDLEEYHNEFKNVSKDWSIETCVADLRNSLEQLERKCKIVEEKINRQETKVFFFGKTSVGKSQIINAILGRSLLVSAQTHSTCCFVHLKKSNNSDWLIKYEGTKEEFNDFDEIKSKLKKLTNSHDLKNKINLNSDKSVECFVVCDKNNKIFKDNTEIVDCPGSANRKEITECIKQHSLDADIFVFVVMASVTDDDRIFFEYQSDQSTKPDIFILVNGCDNGDDDDVDDNNRSMANIKEQCRNFLQKHYNGAGCIEKRIFMISAKEMLNIRKNHKRKENTEKQEERCKEFENFENKIANYIANPKENKFRRYHKDIISLSDEVENAFETFSENINNERSDFILRNYEKKKKELDSLINKISKNCKKFKLNMEGNLTNMIDIVDLFNLDVVNNEIKNRCKNFDDQILCFATSQEEEISDFLKAEDIDKSFKYNWEVKITYLRDENCKMKSVLKNDDDATSKLVARILSVIPIASIIATNIAISRSEQANVNNASFRQEYIDDLKKEIDSMKEKAMKIVKGNVDIIENEINSNIEKIKTIFANKINSFDNYWKEINNRLNRFESILANLE